MGARCSRLTSGHFQRHSRPGVPCSQHADFSVRLPFAQQRCVLQTIMLSWNSGGARCFLVIVVLMFAGCNDEPRAAKQETYGVLQAALVPDVSAIFDVERHQGYTPVISSEPAVVACGSLRCVGAYAAHSFTVATRLDPSTGEMDVPRLFIGDDQQPDAVGARGDEFLIGTSRRVSTDDYEFFYYRLDGATGAILPDNPTSRLPARRLVRAAGAGQSWLLVTSDLDRNLQAQVYDENFEALGPLLALPGFRSASIRVALGDGQFLVADSGQALRINAATGELLDDPAIEYAPDAYDGSVTYHEGVYVFAWRAASMTLSRVDAATGQLLDAAPLEVVAAPTIREGMEPVPGVVSVGDELWLHWDTGSGIDVVAVDVETGAVGGDTSGSLGSLITTLETVPTPRYDVIAMGQHVVTIVNYRYWRVAPLDEAVVSSLGAGGADQAIIASGAPATYPAVASSGDDFLVAWTRGSEIWATRIDAQSGQYLDDPPLVLGEGSRPVVASNGSDYLAVWYAASGAEWRTVGADGTLGEPESTLLFGGMAGLNRLRFDEGKYLLSSNLQLMRFDADGSALGERQTVGEGPCDFFNMNAVTAVGAGIAANQRTIALVAYDEDNDAVLGCRIDFESEEVYGPTPTLFSDHHQPLAVSDGTRVLVLARDTANGNLDGVYLDTATGEILEETRTTLLTMAPDVTVTLAEHTSRGYWLLLERQMGDTSERTLRLFDDSLQPLDEETAGAGIDLSLFRLPNARSYESIRVLPDAWAFNESGRGLLALEPVDVERLAPAIKLQFVDYAGLEEELLPTEPSTPVAAMPDDEPPNGGSGMDAATADDEADARDSDDATETGEAAADAATPGERATDDAPSDGDATDDEDGSESGDDDSASASTNANSAMPEDLDDSQDPSTAADEGGADSMSADGGVDSQLRSADDGGCGCRIGKTPGEAPWATLLLALAVAGVRRRRNALARD